MRELAEEGRKAREARAAAKGAPAPVNAVGEPLVPVPDEGEAYPWPYVYAPVTNPIIPVCVHGRDLTDPCHECGRR
jgi:hypothetical protein